MNRPTVASVEAGLPSATTGLRRGTLSAGFITLLVVSAASPLSVVAGGFPLGIMLGNGAGTPALVVLALGLLLLFAAGYTAMATCVTSAGGFYAMIARGLGGRSGGVAAMVALVGYLTIQFALYGMLGAVMAESLQTQFGLAVPWWVCAFATMFSVAYFGYRQIDFSARVLAGFVVAEYAVMLTLDLMILWSGGAHGINLDSFSPKVVTSGNPFIGLLFCFAAFIGFEATTIYSEEAKNPKRSIPIATFSALLLVGVFYSFSLWCLVLGVGSGDVVSVISALSEPTQLLYGVSDRFVGPYLTLLLRLLFAVSVYAGLISFHNAAARYMYSMGREGLLPAWLGRTHPWHRSPHTASLLQTGICVAVVGGFALGHADPVLSLFTWLSSLATICVLLLMIGTTAAVISYFWRDQQGHGLMRVRWLPVISGLGLCAVLLLAVANFHVLMGTSEHTSTLVLSLVPIAIVLGWATAQRLKWVDPQRFAKLGRDRS
ncbi:MAG: APC family permease [Burkholderiales bacterium]